jgi:hypothetical protein
MAGHGAREDSPRYAVHLGAKFIRVAFLSPGSSCSLRIGIVTVAGAPWLVLSARLVLLLRMRCNGRQRRPLLSFSGRRFIIEGNKGGDGAIKVGLKAGQGVRLQANVGG